MKAMFKKVHVGSKIKDSIGDVLTVKEKRDGIVIATWEGSKGELWIFFFFLLKHYELIEEYKQGKNPLLFLITLSF